MSIETAITAAWQRRAAWLWLLLPLSGLYGLISLLRRQAYKLGLLKSYRAPVAVMVIGNITVGGSGKTPLIITLVTYLQKRNVRVGVISRGYGGDSAQMPSLVTKDSLPSIVGDEPCLIVNMTAVPMAVCPNRKQAIITLLAANPDLQLIVADDGLQHYALQRDIEWIVVDVARGFGNKQLLPTGFLREPLARLNAATVIYHEKTNTAAKSSQEVVSQRLTMQLQPDDLQPLFSNPNQSKSDDSRATKRLPKPEPGEQVHAVSGIGYPQRFFTTLSSLEFEVIPHPYPDHHNFSLADLLQYDQYPIIVTSKDAVKIRTLLIHAKKDASIKGAQPSTNDYQTLLNRLWVLPVTALLSANCYQTLEQQLKDLDIKLTDN